jgi:hypothetical protein
MGTRGSVGILLDGKFKGMYNHSDSYPGGLGDEVVSFIKEVNKTKTGWAKLKKNFRKVEEIKNNQKPTAEQIEAYKGYADLSVSNQTYEDWYCLLRNIQGVPSLTEILKGKLKHGFFANDFIKDSLFCEYAYVINLDDNTVEFYKGFQTSPQEGNRFGTEPNKTDGEYYPCAMVGKCPLNKIPKNWAEKFYKEDEEE